MASLALQIWNRRLNSAMRKPGNSERVMQDGERMVMALRLLCVRHNITACYRTHASPEMIAM